jgi:pimeloyl-ACP methyl ester carboxylesterase
VASIHDGADVFLQPEERTMEQVTLDRMDLQYEVSGTGEPVLLISTGPIADSFLPFVHEEALADHYRLIRYRQRRPDPLTASLVPVSFAEHASDAAALLRHLGVPRAHVAGHSTGGDIALQMAHDHPDVVHSLTLLEPPLMTVPSAGDFLEQAGPALAAYAEGKRESAMKAFMTMVCSLDWETCRANLETHVPGSVEQTLRDADNFFGSYVPALSAWQFGSAQASAITQPVLSVGGTDTQRLFAEGRALLHAWLPQVEDCTIEGVAHLLHLQRPEPVARGVAGFLARHPM